ncbi:glyoxylase-like metal-dependent hydrolase (beta-lactamase superfamily II) [Streptomyces sp. CG 926]|uniref:MBL fold metallo-hydrolase n=1 Tax=Streptomyces sp. CG 926 TaxID=1882405 RepID=UPI000D794E1F|nr:MBL fold metallo-hydrolase [Streptomyces sp. CG 926]PWK69344.1 glyoxylase-like metal-dependent hydrolase (beta-lactamase superfamily II) [Streptomyces sp. CG 926]
MHSRTRGRGRPDEALTVTPERLERIVLTRCHRDQVGAAGELAARRRVRVPAHRSDAPVIRGERPVPVPEPVLLDREIPPYAHGPAVPEAPTTPTTPVDHEVEDGEALDSGTGPYVVHAPGPTDGSIGIHRPRHGVLFTGDYVGAVGRPLPDIFDVDRRRAIASFHRPAALAPSVARFGHGDPLTVGTAAAAAASGTPVRGTRPRYPSEVPA